MAVQHDALMVNGIRLDVYSPKGVAPSGALVFLHGTGAHGGLEGDVNYGAFFWASAALGIAVVAPTLPGHGLSLGRRGAFRLSDYINCSEIALQEARKRWGRKVSIICMGWSQGGIGATIVADRLGHAFDGFFLHNATDPGNIESMRLFSVYVSNNPILNKILKMTFNVQVTLLLNGLGRISPSLRFPTRLYLPLGKIFEGDSKKMQEWFWDQEIVRWYSLEAIKSLVSTPLRDLTKVGVPVMVYYPTNDIPPRWHQEHMAGRFGPWGNFMAAEGLGHSAIRKHPELVAETVGQFLRNVQNQRTARKTT